MIDLINRTTDYKCMCDLCKRYRDVRAMIQSGTREELCQLVTELSNQLVEVECDLNYQSAILDGSWPNSVKLLQKALAKAKAFKKSKADVEAYDRERRT